MHAYLITWQLTAQVVSQKKLCQVIKFLGKYFLACLHVEQVRCVVVNTLRNI